MSLTAEAFHVEHKLLFHKYMLPHTASLKIKQTASLKPRRMQQAEKREAMLLFTLKCYFLALAKYCCRHSFQKYITIPSITTTMPKNALGLICS